ncbi:hypothetical protein BDZ94DRAFT_1320699 [Collybia nuda]|uniref:HIG1 domain-containing protein n=1 Tax=Collybia nuda TaxID=64659 RepID=A0A9P5Y8V1_9AGAR|nr:hypothetical protein BDZ94DRAFT_1320699 [Collybia nuda]
MGKTGTHLEAQEAASRRGAIEGALGSTIVAGLGSYYLHRRYPVYRALPLSLKSLGVIILIAPALTIQAERRGIEYERSQWEGEGVRLLSVKQEEEKQRWEQLSRKEKFADWADRNQYTLILGGWATSLGVAGLIISRDKIQTTAQKVVQARMWAQGLTIGLLIVAGALTQHKRAEAAQHLNNDHSWKALLDQQERDKQEAARRLKEEATPPSRRLPATL